MTQSAKHIIFTGRVQGVGFRFTAYSMAKRYQLNGIVRNLLNGGVEMIAQGDSEDIAGCIRDIQESFAGYINNTEVEDAPLTPERKEFKITF